MGDIVERLRIFANEPIGDPRGEAEQLADESADEIERLRRLLGSARERADWERDLRLGRAAFISKRIEWPE